MGFVENLLEKIDIDRTAESVKWSMGPPDSGRRIDKALARKLFGVAGYEKVVRRDLEMYRMPADASGRERIIVLDNDLPVYRTGVDDVTLRKSPTVKEMVNIRNAIKILNDSDVLVCKKDDSVNLVRHTCIATLDLSYSDTDIDGIARGGVDALSSGHTEGIQEALTLFGELLGYAAPPKKLAFAHHDIIGFPEKTDAGMRYAPLVLYDRANNMLKLMDGPVAVGDAADLKSVQSVITGEETADIRGPEVFGRLKDAVFQAPYVPA